MFKAVRQTYSINIRYAVNMIVFFLTKIPLVKKLLPKNPYGNVSLKSLGYIISLSIDLGMIFAGKVIYVAVVAFIVGAANGDTANWIDVILTMLLPLTIAGGILRTHIFNTTKQDYYALFLMRLPANEYAKGNYISFLLLQFVGFLPIIPVAVFFGAQNILSFVFFPLYVVCIKLIGAAVILFLYRRFDRPPNENTLTWKNGIAVALVVAAAFMMPQFDITIPTAVVLVVYALALAVAIPCALYLFRFNDYKSALRLAHNKLSAVNVKSIAAQRQKETVRKFIADDVSVTSAKRGYAFFNDLFVKRHQKVLFTPIKRITLGAIGVSVALAVACLFFDVVAEVVNLLMVDNFSYIILVLYLTNRSMAIASAMFINCDSSMLTYSFYCRRSDLMQLFIERIKSLVKLNLMPAAVLAVAAPALLLLSGGTEHLIYYPLMFISVILLSVFFSVHYIAVYYLLQPYNIGAEIKSPTYIIANMVVYILTFILYGAGVSVPIFTILVAIACLVYTPLVMFLVYRFAHKTFKLR